MSLIDNKPMRVAVYTVFVMRYPIVLFAICVSVFGCVKRSISISSQPSGALVWVNDREVGRTPVHIDFLYYGEYDVRVEGEGQEPIMTTRRAKSAAWGVPVLDLVVESVSDQNVIVRWHFELEKRNDDSALLIQRAKDVRDSVRGGDGE